VPGVVPGVVPGAGRPPEPVVVCASAVRVVEPERAVPLVVPVGAAGVLA
jgi:hypothetical protein